MWVDAPNIVKILVYSCRANTRDHLYTFSLSPAFIVLFSGTLFLVSMWWIGCTLIVQSCNSTIFNKVKKKAFSCHEALTFKTIEMWKMKSNNAC